MGGGGWGGVGWGEEVSPFPALYITKYQTQRRWTAQGTQQRANTHTSTMGCVVLAENPLCSDAAWGVGPRKEREERIEGRGDLCREGGGETPHFSGGGGGSGTLTLHDRQQGRRERRGGRGTIAPRALP
eukprot:Sspe_Gene.95696::Locus_68001_Transcript_1_1_Confidence_1.000_Length_518::g.95696::m.95696